MPLSSHSFTLVVSHAVTKAICLFLNEHLILKPFGVAVVLCMYSPPKDSQRQDPHLHVQRRGLTENREGGRPGGRSTSWYALLHLNIRMNTNDIFIHAPFFIHNETSLNHETIRHHHNHPRRHHHHHQQQQSCSAAAASPLLPVQYFTRSLTPHPEDFAEACE